jgi:signal transduction histidine kinase
MVNIITYSLSFFAATFLGIVILYQRKRAANVVFVGICFSVAFWISLLFLADIVVRGAGNLLVGRLTIVGPIIIAPLILHFASIFPTRTKENKYSIFVVYIPSLLFLPFINTNLNVEKTILHSWGQEVVTGPMYLVMMVYVAAYLLAASVILLRKKKKLLGVRRQQISYILLGIILSATIGLLTNALLPLLGISNLSIFGPPATLFFAGFTVYSITKHSFLDIRLVILRTLTFGFLVSVITGLFAIISSILGNILSSVAGFQSDIITGIAVGFIVALGYLPTRKALERVTSRILFKQSYTPEDLLSRVTQVTSSVLDLKELLESVSNELLSAFKQSRIGFVLLDDQQKLQVIFERGFAAGEAKMLSTGTEAVMAQQFVREPGFVVLDEMISKYEAGEYQPISKELMYALHEHDIAIVAPLYVKEKLRGVLALGNKKSGDVYTTQDLNVLEIICGQLAVSIDNARLYDAMRQFNATLQHKVDDATKELQGKNTELNSANQQLKILDQQKSDFISIASHQLRTPLTVIKGYISMMREGSFGKLEPTIMENLEKVYTANERLIRLVEDLLDISRIESGRQEFIWAPLDVEKLATEVVNDLQQNAQKKGLTLRLEKSATALPTANADGGKLHEVMMNFVDNAIKYSKEGSIVVTIAAEPEGMLTFRAKDTGMGMTPETISALFKKFSRGKGSFHSHTEGLGLGLYVAKMVVDAHEGKIWAESEGLGKGSTFAFSIPIAGPKNPPPSPSKAAPFAGGGEVAETPAAPAPTAGPAAPVVEPVAPQPTTAPAPVATPAAPAPKSAKAKPKKAITKPKKAKVA